MALEKLIIKAEKTDENDFAETIKVLFNPKQIQIVKTGGKFDKKGPVSGENLATLTLDLFFDTTLLKDLPANVQFHTRPIVNLTQPRIPANNQNGSPHLKRIPRCKLIWGTISGNDCVLLPDGFLESVTIQLTHFLEDGTPVRATLNCTFREWQDPKTKQKTQNPIDDPVRIVRRGETLSQIASEEYGDGSLWRIIAQENRIIDPRKLTPGQILTIPPLR